MTRDLFADDAVPLAILRERAFNLRWATLPEGVIALTAADPDFPVAQPIRDAIKQYVGSGVLSYGPPEGLPRFRQTVARTMNERRGIRCSADEILATNSAASAMFIVAKYALQPGDEAIIFDPVDFLFKASVEAAGGRAVLCPIDKQARSLDVDAVRARITPRTRMIGVCNPHNPLGIVTREAELRALGELAIEHDLLIMADEIWSDIVYPPARFTSLAALSPEIAERTISVYGFSKTFGLAGLRVGFLVAPNRAVFQSLLEASQAATTSYGVSTVSQIAAQAAYESCWPWAAAFVNHLGEMRDLAVSRLNAMDGVSCTAPDGTYVVFPDVSGLGMGSSELAAHLLDKARVAVVPGETRWFGPGAQGHIRICLATSRSILSEGLDRIEHALATCR